MDKYMPVTDIITGKTETHIESEIRGSIEQGHSADDVIQLLKDFKVLKIPK